MKNNEYIKQERNFVSKNRDNKLYSHLTQSFDFLNKERKLLMIQLSELRESDNYSMEKEFELRDKLNQCNIERMLLQRRDLINTYLVIQSSLSDAYDVLFSLPEQSKRITEIEHLIFDLEKGLAKIKNDLHNEGVSEKETINYYKKYE